MNNGIFFARSYHSIDIFIFNILFYISIYREPIVLIRYIIYRQ